MSSFKRLAVLPVAILILVALLACKKNKKEPTESTASAAVEEVGIPECDDFLRKYEKCVSEKYPEAAQPTAKQSIVQMRNTWKQAAANPLTKPAIASGCKTAADATQKATAAYGCVW